MVPSTRVVSVKKAQFKYGLQHFVASSASVVGEVAAGEMTSMWYGATVRGEWLALGARCARGPPPREAG